MQISVPDKPSDLKWACPVYIRIGNGSREKVVGPASALVYLAQRWPAVDGRERERAQTSCMSAMAGKFSVERCRADFVEAAIEAQMLSQS